MITPRRHPGAYGALSFCVLVAGFAVWSLGVPLHQEKLFEELGRAMIGGAWLGAQASLILWSRHWTQVRSEARVFWLVVISTVCTLGARQVFAKVDPYLADTCTTVALLFVAATAGAIMARDDDTPKRGEL